MGETAVPGTTPPTSLEAHRQTLLSCGVPGTDELWSSAFCRKEGVTDLEPTAAPALANLTFFPLGIKSQNNQANNKVLSATFQAQSYTQTIHIESFKGRESLNKTTNLIYPKPHQFGIRLI